MRQYLFMIFAASIPLTSSCLEFHMAGKSYTLVQTIEYSPEQVSHARLAKYVVRGSVIPLLVGLYGMGSAMHDVPFSTTSLREALWLASWGSEARKQYLSTLENQQQDPRRFGLLAQEKTYRAARRWCLSALLTGTSSLVGLCGMEAFNHIMRYPFSRETHWRSNN